MRQTKEKEPLLHSCVYFTDVQLVPMDWKMGWQQKRNPKDYWFSKKTELGAVQTFERDPQSTDVPRICGCLPGPTATIGGLESYHLTTVNQSRLI